MSKRCFSFLMAALLVLSTVMVAAPVKSQAAVTDQTYTFSELDSPMEYGLKSEITSDGTLNITFEDQYKSKFFKIPDDIEPAAITKVTFKLTKGAESALAFKLHDQADYDSDNKEGTPVSYGKAEITPSAGKDVKYFSIMSLNTGKTEASIESVTFSVSDEVAASSKEETVVEGENIIPNGNFDSADVSMWTAESGEAVISVAEADEPIFDDVKTYGVINKRTRSYDCIAMDITDKVTNGSTYAFSFYAMLSDDYKDAPADQRQVDFAPYITSGGNTSYLGSYSAELSGDVSQQLTPGKWTKFSGTFKVAAAGNLDKVVIRLLEQGTNYGEGDCVKGEYYVTGVSLIDMNLATGSIQESIPNLKDAMCSDLGSDFIVGTSLSGSEINDRVLMELVEKHFNAITLGNELKPDSMFGYSNDKVPMTEITHLNGERLVVPKLDFSRAEVYLDYILDWNEQHPDSQMKVRGHVLVWHSQTPEWFFHEEYDASKPYVTTDVMNLRQEWYIKSVLEHFVGSDSPYKDLFYGWDVVNEAVSDSTGTYRSDSENSSWWAVYKSEEFIKNAFVYANKYAPETLELYYNDYNDCTPGKVEGIVNLLKTVKATEGARIDAMGMQGHYDINYPTAEAFKDSAEKYGEVVGKVMLTELDLKSSNTYDGTEATLQDEYTKQAYKYKELYDSMKELNNGSKVKVTGMTVWGVIDGNSWLQAYTGVGGGVTDGSPQCPLLFDDDYHAKPAYWAFVDPSKLAPMLHSINIVQAPADSFENAGEIAFEDLASTFKAIWNEGQLQFMVNVVDHTNDASDKVTVYLDRYNSKSEGIKTRSVEVARADAEATENGYVAYVTVPMEEAANNVIAGFDVVITDGTDKYAFNDKTMTQDSSSKYFAEGMLKPFMYIPMGSAIIDGEMDDIWNSVDEVVIGNANDAPKASATARVMWDSDFLYVYAQVKDPDLNKESEQPHEQDSLEVFIDEINSKADAYNDATKQYRINYENEHSFNGDKCTEENLKTVAKKTEDGYVVEGAFRWTEISPKEGEYLGIELQINDADSTGARIGTLTWNDLTNQCWSSPSCFGTAMYVAAPEKSVEQVTEAQPTQAVATEEGNNSKSVGVVLLACAAAVGGLAALNGRKRKGE